MAESQIILSDGKTATVRRPKGRDVIRAQRACRDKDDRFELALALLAQVTTIDGRGVTVEDVQELYVDDINTLVNAMGGDGFLSRRAASSSSSSTDSNLPN